MKKGMIFDVRKYSIHDGPGIRTAVFFKGCPLRCWWCHNPEGQNPKPELVFRRSRCISCGECVEKCHQHAISSATLGISINREKCVLCSDCSDACSSEALSIAGKEMSVKKVVEEIEKDRAFYEESSGGVTFSGGEPLLQPEFLKALLDECNNRALHTTLDTCGYSQPEIIDGICSKVDLFLYDIKIIDDQRHMKFTGVSNKQILRNLEKLAEKGSNIVVSFPIIPGINDDDRNVAETAKFISSLPNIQQINLLPYHRAGIQKYKNLGKPYKLNKIQPPTDKKVKSVKNKMEAFGLKVGIGGG
ncbi:MAG TPA: glycyl-radical enzyme activating protein [Candidatus Bathyarchaeia archaeon]|nr:glycyl-radical enzyme activating protein [Candidatus Bathyarchaeia archaeon]